jgi:membrane protein insertase Oxa1/YidC/SpoIIIJ
MMNAFMLVLFYNLPSGLVFYWTVMNLASAFQQWMVLRQDSSAVVVVEPAGGRKKKSG